MSYGSYGDTTIGYGGRQVVYITMQAHGSLVSYGRHGPIPTRHL